MVKTGPVLSDDEQHLGGLSGQIGQETNKTDGEDIR